MGALLGSSNTPQNGTPLNAGNWNAGTFGQQANTLASMASSKAEALAAQSRDTGKAMMPGQYEGLLGQAAQWQDVASKGAGGRLYGINSPFGISNGNGGWNMPQVLGSFSVGGYQGGESAPAPTPAPNPNPAWLNPGMENSSLFGPTPPSPQVKDWNGGKLAPGVNGTTGGLWPFSLGAEEIGKGLPQKVAPPSNVVGPNDPYGLMPMDNGGARPGYTNDPAGMKYFANPAQRGIGDLLDTILGHYNGDRVGNFFTPSGAKADPVQFTGSSLLGY